MVERKRSVGYKQTHPMRRKEDTKVYTRKILILGSKQCGKKSLVEKYLNNTFMEDRYFKNQPITVDKKYKHTRFSLDIVNSTLQNTTNFDVETADLIMLVYEIDNIKSAREMLEMYKRIRETREDKMPLLIIGTKLDLQKMESPLTRYKENDSIKTIINQIKGAQRVLTSAKYNIGVRDAFSAGLNDMLKTIHTLPLSQQTIKVNSSHAKAEKIKSSTVCQRLKKTFFLK